MEVEMLKWHVQPGDRVKQFDKLCDVQSDKVRHHWYTMALDYTDTYYLYT